MKVETTRSLDRGYVRLTEEMQARAQRQLALLASDPRHPSLRLKGLSGETGLWEIRISRGYRITLQIEGERAILRRIGTHDVLRNP